MWIPKNHLHCVVLPKPFLAETVADVATSLGGFGRRPDVKGKGRGSKPTDLPVGVTWRVRRGLPSPTGYLSGPNVGRDS